MSQILDDIRTGTFSRVYLIYGEEAYLRRDRLSRLLKALLPENDDMNVTRFAGKDVDTSDVELAKAIIAVCENAAGKDI